MGNRLFPASTRSFNAETLWINLLNVLCDDAWHRSRIEVDVVMRYQGRLIPALLALLCVCMPGIAYCDSSVPACDDFRVVSSNDPLYWEEILEMANNGDACAQLKLGASYLFGKGVKKDKEESLSWLERSASNGNLKAMVHLGWLYYDADKPFHDNKKAVEWYRRAADNGSIEANYFLGWHYFNGIGVDRNARRAEALFRKAAEKGHANAAYEFAQIIRWETGGEAKLQEAIKWYRKAAEGGVAIAQFEMGDFYFHGDGVKEDYVTALDWFIKAHHNGDDYALDYICDLTLGEFVDISIFRKDQQQQARTLCNNKR